MIGFPGPLLGPFLGSLFGPVLDAFWRPLGAFGGPLGKPFGTIWGSLKAISGKRCELSRLNRIKRPGSTLRPGVRIKMALQTSKRPSGTGGEVRQKCFWTRELSFRLSSASDAPAWCLGVPRAWSARDPREEPKRARSARAWF